MAGERIAIVTDSDSGIGRATAVRLAHEGCDVGITWHTDEEGAHETAQSYWRGASRIGGVGPPPILRLLLARARSRGRLSLGRRVRLGPGVRFDVARGARVVVGDGAVLGAGCRLHVHAGSVEIGAGAHLGERCVVAAHERVEIGASCRLADEVVLVDFDHVAADPERPVREQGLVTAPVRVGAGAVLDRGACLLRGVTVGAGARVLTHAVVTRDVAAAPR
jgi:acetyltransferase-like isoleucine patch superfamily enzyme